MRLYARGEITEYGDAFSCAYLQSTSGVMFTTQNVVSFTVRVFEGTDGATPATALYTNGPLSAAAGFFDTRQVDDYATDLGDGLGYNFLYVLPETDYHLEGGRSYRMEIVIETAAFGKYVLVNDITVNAVYS